MNRAERIEAAAIRALELLRSITDISSDLAEFRAGVADELSAALASDADTVADRGSRDRCSVCKGARKCVRCAHGEYVCLECLKG